MPIRNTVAISLCALLVACGDGTTTTTTTSTGTGPGATVTGVSTPSQISVVTPVQ